MENTELAAMTKSMINDFVATKIDNEISKLINSGAIDTEDANFLQARAVLCVVLENYIDSIKASHSKVFTEACENLKNF